MSEIANPTRIITTTSGEEKPLKDADYDELPDEVRKYFTPLEVLPPGYPDHRALHTNIISAQQGFKRGFVATSALQEQTGRSRIDVQRNYQAGTESFSIGRVLAMAYEEKATRELIDQAEVEDPEKADYLRVATSPDADNQSQARNNRTIAEWANVLYNQPKARADGWTPERLFELGIEVARAQRSIAKLEKLAGIDDSAIMHIAAGLYLPFGEIVRDTCETHGSWRNNQAVENEFQEVRAEVIKDPSTTLGELRNIIREWLEHEPRDDEDTGYSEGLLYSLRLDRDWGQERLQAIQDGTYAEQFGQPENSDK